MSLIIINIAVAEKSISQIMNVIEIDYVNSDTYYFFILFCEGGCANAVPHYQKLRTRVSHVWGNRKLQLGEVQCTSLHLRELPS